ncbi:MAG: galactosyl-1-phosphate transferase [Acidobacteria bacterium]|nr:MAG: galactosyl-1-phosphate transferase [Acidobacteriota bacterium]
MSDSPFLRPTLVPEPNPAVVFPELIEIHPPRLQIAESAWLHSRGKRIFDLVFTAVVLPFALPLFLLIPAAILLESRGPICFQHRRLGRNGRMFWMFKFCTMIDGADVILSQLLDSDPEVRHEFAENYKLKNDPRITRLGRFLRRLSLDELPQIFNVIKGEISWVGPRPIVQPEVKKYGRYAPALLRMKPGVTGLWQANGRSGLAYEERVRLDMEYLSKASLWLDIKTIVKTLPVVLSRAGAM